MEPATAVLVVFGMLILPAIVIRFEKQKCIGRLPFLGIILGAVIAGVITNGISEVTPLASILGVSVLSTPLFFVRAHFSHLGNGNGIRSLISCNCLLRVSKLTPPIRVSASNPTNFANSVSPNTSPFESSPSLL